jgi:hypothetical protein
MDNFFLSTRLSLTTRKKSLGADHGQTYEQNPLPKKKPKTNKAIKTITLPDTIPLIAADTLTYGDRKFKMTGNKTKLMNVVIYLAFLFDFIFDSLII